MAGKKLSDHIDGLVKYLSQPEEKANEDLIIKYFRHVYSDSFSRQKEAKRADGYVPGHFVLELKGKHNDWFAGLFQGVAYQRELDFSLIVVAAKRFLAVWRVEDVPQEIREAIILSSDAPNEIGKKFSIKYRSEQIKLLRKAIWTLRPETLDGLFKSPDVLLAQVAQFEATVKKQRKVRHKITLKNFTTILKEMVPFFERDKPMMAVRAFYSMLFGWKETSKLEISNKVNHQATLCGEIISHLVPGKRVAFKEYVESHFVHLGPDENEDDFFARYDKALDTVDSKFRAKHGIFFTDLTLSKFAMWFVRKHLGDIGKNHLVIDPACGSGNLITNWRSPLELRHKVVSEIEPELLFTVEKRMKSDAWHDGKFTVVPKVAEGRGLNFIDISAKEYLNILTKYLKEKGHKPDKPLAILCNPPYKNDDDQSDGEIDYEAHHTIVELIGKDPSGERSNCFLAQMKLLAETAEDSGLPGQTLLMLFTGIPWLTSRPVYKAIREQITGSFQDVGAFMVNSQEFFDVPGKFPVAFSIWRYCGQNANLDANRSIPVIDLTWVNKDQLDALTWDDREKLGEACESILEDDRAIEVKVGLQYENIREWSGQKRFDFQREKTKAERKSGAAFLCGLPVGDGRHGRKKTLGHSDGVAVGFMDDLTPCRIRRDANGLPWFRLNTQFMEFQKTRCFSGPADNRAFAATDEESAKKMFFWYSMNRTFKQIRYPMWANNFEMWGVPSVALEDQRFIQYSFGIAFAENECVETVFPANNPVAGAPEIRVRNPLSPNDKSSFWSRHMAKFFSDSGKSSPDQLVQAVNELYKIWRKKMNAGSDVYVDYKKEYFVGDGILRENSGIVQIQDYAAHTKDEQLLAQLNIVWDFTKKTKEEFYAYLMDEDGVNYFSQSNLPPKAAEQVEVESIDEVEPATDPAIGVIPAGTRFEKTLEKRLAISNLITSELNEDPNFGRVKFAKIFYLCDEESGLELQTEYTREAAGPLDQRTLYNESVGIEALAARYSLFTTKTIKRGRSTKVDYVVGPSSMTFKKRIKEVVGSALNRINEIIAICRPMNTDQTEIVATLYACWKDLLLMKKDPTSERIVDEFLNRWHPKKKRFKEDQLLRALDWMKAKGLIPSAKGKKTKVKDRIDTEKLPF